MSNRLKKWCYWLTLVGPVIDIVHGALVGIMNAWTEAKAERYHEKACRIYDEELAQFRKDNEND